MEQERKRNPKKYKLDKVEVRLRLKKSGGLYSTEPMNSPSAAVRVMADAMAQLDREYVCVVNLNNQAQPINYNVVSIGTLNQASASKANIFKSAILSNAHAIILLHCHPSGGVKPSKEDTDLTISLIQAGKLMDIAVLDHIIVGCGTGETFSFREKTEIFSQRYEWVAENSVREESQLNMESKLTDGIREGAIFHAKENAMDFKQFRDEVKKDLSGKLNYGVSIDDVAVKKLQGESYEGITIKPENSKIGVTLSLEGAFHSVKSGTMTVGEVADSIAERASAALEERPFNVDLDTFNNYDAMKDKLILEVVNTESNRDMLEDVPRKDIEDLSVVCRFDVSNDENGATILVTNELLDRYGISKEQLFADAEANAPEKSPVVLNTLGNVIGELTGGEMPEEPVPILVATNERKTMGASVIDYPGFMDEVADKVGGDFFVIPSSIHEILIMKDDGTQDYKDLEAMVRDVNANVVEACDRLSDNVYHFDDNTKIFELASKHDAREASKERDTEVQEKKNSVLGDLGEKKDACRGEVKFAESPKKYAEQEL
ncbi:MAG: DUF5688 family protein [Lachnospiraceae bacterium]|nr:DUF5688 family protein [Lachnospiraceae bacterium]